MNWAVFILLSVTWIVLTMRSIRPRGVWRLQKAVLAWMSGICWILAIHCLVLTMRPTNGWEWIGVVVLSVVYSGVCLVTLAILRLVSDE